MATLIFEGTRVGAVGSANDDGTGGVDLILDQSQDLDGNGNPYYAATDLIEITIADEDIGPNGELQTGGADGVVTVTSILVNGVEILSSPDKIKFSGSGGDTFEGDAYFFVEGVKLFFLTPVYSQDFSDSTLNGGDLELNVSPRVSDLDLNSSGSVETGTVEEGNGVFNIFAAGPGVIHDGTDFSDNGSIIGTAASETVYGGISDGQPDGGLVINDTIDAGGGDDVIYAGDGDDSIDAGDGNDTVVAGAGADTVSGGAGDDTFVYTVGDGADTITDFNTGNTGTLADGDTTNNDFIDLSGFYDNIWELHADQADDGVLNQSNNGVNGVDYSDNTQFAPGDSLVFAAAVGDNTFFTFENTGVVCYAAGTRILTPFGEVALETLAVGDEVITCDRGAKPIRWIRRTRHTWSKAPDKDKPICIKAGALGAGLPLRDLVVSPQHRILIPDIDAPEGVLVPAKAMTGLKGVRQMKGRRQVDYIHLLFDRHEVILAEGIPSESFFPGDVSQHNLSAADRDDIREVLLRVVQAGSAPGYPPARPFRTVAAAKRALAALSPVWTEVRLSNAGLVATAPPKIRRVK